MSPHRLTAVILLLLALTFAHAQPMKPCDLMKLLMEPDEKSAERGAAGFLAMGQQAAVPLLCFISGTAAGAPPPNDLGKKRSEDVLVRLGSAAVPAILERLPTTNEEFRTRLVRILGRIPDARREAPLGKLWETERSDRVRAVLVHAFVSFNLSKRADALAALRQRIPAAGPQELRALAAQLALRGTDADLTAVLGRVPAADRAAFIADAVAALRELEAVQHPTASGALARPAIRKLEARK